MLGIMGELGGWKGSLPCVTLLLFTPLEPTPRAYAVQWGDLRRAPKPGPGQQPDVLLTLRASNAAMRSSQYQEEIINQVGAEQRCGGKRRHSVASVGLHLPACSCNASTLLSACPVHATDLSSTALTPHPAGDGAAGGAPGLLGLPHRLPRARLPHYLPAAQVHEDQPRGPVQVSRSVHCGLGS